MTSTISFIIPHKGREELLVKTVDSILHQDYKDVEYEILIVTQNQELKALTELSNINESIKIFYQTENLTISALRNYGVEKSNGEYLAFLDADIQLSNNWLSCMLTTLNEQPQRILTSAAQINSDLAPPLEKIRTALSNAELDCNVNFLPGRNLFLTRESFYRVNGFPEHLITCEDYYFTDQLHQLGQLYYTSKANYVHLGEDKQYSEMYKKEIWRGQSNLQSIKGRSIPLREIPSFVIPPILLICFIMFILSIAIGAYNLAVASSLLILLPISAYSLRLYNLTKHEVTLWQTLKFYLIYFPARAIGTLGGLFKSFSNISTQKSK